jgi:hypothetical protein
VRRRAWAEPNVRFRWVFALIVLLGGFWFAISGVQSWLRDKSLMQVSPISATISQANSDIHPGRPVPPGATVYVQWKKDGQTVTSAGTLSGYSSKAPPNIGEDIQIRVDPEDTNRWTARNEPPTLMPNLLPAIACILFALVVVLTAWLRRRRVLQIWRDAPVQPASVLEWQHTPLAPRSRSAKCTLEDDARVFSVVIPAKAAERAKTAGQIQVLVPQHGQRLAVDWFA